MALPSALARSANPMVWVAKAMPSDAIATRRGPSRATIRWATKPTAATKYSARLMPKKIRSMQPQESPQNGSAGSTASSQIGSQGGQGDVASDVLGKQPIDRRRVGARQVVEEIRGDQPRQDALALFARQRLRLQMSAQAGQDV